MRSISLIKSSACVDNDFELSFKFFSRSKTLKQSSRLNCCVLIVNRSSFILWMLFMQSLRIRKFLRYRIDSIEQHSSSSINFKRNSKRSLQSDAYRFMILVSCTLVNILNCMRFSSNELNIRSMILLMNVIVTLDVIFARRSIRLRTTINSIKLSIVKIFEFFASNLVCVLIESVKQRFLLEWIACINSHIFFFSILNVCTQRLMSVDRIHDEVWLMYWSSFERKRSNDCYHCSWLLRYWFSRLIKFSCSDEFARDANSACEKKIAEKLIVKIWIDFITANAS